MVGKKPTKKEIEDAISKYLVDHPGVQSTYDDASDSYLLKDVNGKEAIVGSGFSVEDDALKEELSEIIMNNRDSGEAAKGSNLPIKREANIAHPEGRNGQGGVLTGNAAQAIQTMQAGKHLTYTVQKKAAPNATMALMAATDAKINLVEVNSILTDELTSSTIRATRKDRSVDATVSIRKLDFINLLAWKEVQAQEAKKNYILDDSDPMNIALPNGFPRIKPDATISVEIKEELGNRWEKRRAMVHIYLTAMQQWIFQQRQCQTKAKRNAIIQALTSSGNPTETMDEEELEDEMREIELVGP